MGLLLDDLGLSPEDIHTAFVQAAVVEHEQVVLKRGLVVE